MKRTENIQADMLSKKPGYKKNREPKNFVVFWTNKNNLVLNKK
jgi:hypothetical protein